MRADKALFLILQLYSQPGYIQLRGEKSKTGFSSQGSKLETRYYHGLSTKLNHVLLNCPRLRRRQPRVTFPLGNIRFLKLLQICNQYRESEHPAARAPTRNTSCYQTPLADSFGYPGRPSYYILWESRSICRSLVQKQVFNFHSKYYLSYIFVK